MPQNWWDTPAPPPPPPGRTDPPGTSGHWWDAPAPVAAPAAPIGADVAAAPSLWDRLNTPVTSALSSAGKYLGDKLGLKSLADKLNASATEPGVMSTLKGFAAGAMGGAGSTPGGLEAAGKGLEQAFLSPAGAAMTVGGVGAGAAASAGLRGTSAALRALETGGAAVNAAQGVEHAIKAPDTQGKWLGGFQAAMGGLGTIAGARGVGRFFDESAAAAPRIAPGQTAGDYAPAAAAPGRMGYVPQDVPGVPYERSGGGSTQPNKSNLYSDATEPTLPAGPRRAASRVTPLRGAPAPDVEMAPSPEGNWWEQPAPTGPITHADQVAGLEPGQVAANTGARRSAASIVQDAFFRNQPSPRGAAEPFTADEANAIASGGGSEPLGGPEWRSPFRAEGQQPLEPVSDAAPSTGEPSAAAEIPGAGTGRVAPQPGTRTPFQQLDPRVQHGLRWLYSEMDSLPFVDRTWYENQGGEGIGAVNEAGSPFDPGTGGTPVFHDIMTDPVTGAEKAGSRGAVISAIRRIITGKKPSALGQRAIDVATRRAGMGEANPNAPALSPPQLPPDAGAPLNVPWDTGPHDEAAIRSAVENAQRYWRPEATHGVPEPAAAYAPAAELPAPPGPELPARSTISRLGGATDTSGGGLLPEDAPRGSYFDRATGRVVPPDEPLPAPSSAAEIVARHLAQAGEGMPETPMAELPPLSMLSRGVDLPESGGGLLPPDAPRGSYVDRATGRVMPPDEGMPAPAAEIHPLIRQAHESLLPKWAADVARQKGDGNPIGVIDPTEDLQAFNDRVMNEPDPRKLWSTERKARLAIDAERRAKGDTGESGFIDPTAAFHAASTLGGGVVGGGLGAWVAPKGRKLKGGVEGALLGAALPTLIQHPEAAQALRAFGLFGSPVTVAKKVLADSSNVLGEAFTRGVSGQGGAGKLLRSVFSPETASGIAQHFRNPEASSTGFPTPQPFSPKVQAVVGAPTRALGAVTAGMRDAIMRGDLSPAEADRLTSIADPQTDIGKGLLAFHQKGGALARFAMPVARVPINMFEMGAEATPGLGYAKLAGRALKGDMPTGTEWARATAKQGIGGAAMAYGAHEQATRDPNAKESAAEKVARVLLTTGLGGYGMVPEALGAGMEAAREKNPPAGTTVPGRMMSAAAQTLIRNLPLPTGLDLPSHWPGQFAPGALTTAGELAGGPAPNTLEQPDALDALIARIPWLNQLLAHKATPGGTRMAPMEMGHFK